MLSFFAGCVIFYASERFVDHALYTAGLSPLAKLGAGTSVKSNGTSPKLPGTFMNTSSSSANQTQSTHITSIYSSIYSIVRSFIVAEEKNRPTSLPTCVMYGRGPTILTSKVNESDYDVVIRMKQCNCKRWPDARCDVVVLYEGEIDAMGIAEYDINTCQVDNVWLFDPYGKRKNKTEYEPLYSNKTIHSFKTEGGKLDYIGRQFGFHPTSFPRFTTGMATILEAFDKCAHPITLVAFDNIAYNMTLGEADRPERLGCIIGTRCEQQHNLRMEAAMIKVLRLIGAVHTYPLSNISEEHVSIAKQVLSGQA